MNPKESDPVQSGLNQQTGGATFDSDGDPAETAHAADARPNEAELHRASDQDPLRGAETITAPSTEGSVSESLDVIERPSSVPPPGVDVLPSAGQPAEFPHVNIPAPVAESGIDETVGGHVELPGSTNEEPVGPVGIDLQVQVDKSGRPTGNPPRKRRGATPVRRTAKDLNPDHVPTAPPCYGLRWGFAQISKDGPKSPKWGVNLADALAQQGFPDFKKGDLVTIGICRKDKVAEFTGRASRSTTAYFLIAELSAAGFQLHEAISVVVLAVRSGPPIGNRTVNPSP